MPVELSGAAVDGRQGRASIERRTDLRRTVRVLARRWFAPPARVAGVLAVHGITSPVVIRRDRYGIVHIDAQDDEDAWCAAGFCQGQDRTRRVHASRAADGPFAQGLAAGVEQGRRRPQAPAAWFRPAPSSGTTVSSWYLVHLRTPSLHVAGAQRVGHAELVAGHDEEHAWPDRSEGLPGLRFRAPAGAGWAALRVAYLGGQSDDPESRHFDDLSPFWRSGNGVPIAWTRDEVAVAAVSTLRLEPATPPERARGT